MVEDDKKPRNIEDVREFAELLQETAYRNKAVEGTLEFSMRSNKGDGYLVDRSYEFGGIRYADKHLHYDSERQFGDNGLHDAQIRLGSIVGGAFDVDVVGRKNRGNGNSYVVRVSTTRQFEKALRESRKGKGYRDRGIFWLGMPLED